MFETRRIFLSLFLAATLKVSVTDVHAQTSTSSLRIEGVAAYNSAELLSFAAQLEAQRTGQVTAEGIAEIVETIYREDGYILAEVFVERDRSTIVVEEGEIGSVTIEGVDGKTFELVRSYLEPLVGKPAVTQAEIERAVMLVEDIQSLTANTEIFYKDADENAHLRVVATPLDTSSGFITLDHPARDIGDAATLTLNQEFISLLTPGDLFRVEVSGTATFDNDENDLFASLSYRAPLGGRGTYWEVYLGNAVGDRDETGNLRQTDLEGNSAILAIGHPFLRNVDTYGYLLGEVRRSNSDNDVEGVSTDFESTVNVIAATWIYGHALENGGAFEYAVNLSFGSRTSDAIGFDDGDKDFWHLRAGAGYQQPTSFFGENSFLRAEFWGQYTPDRLPSIEEFYLGGIDDERGYVFGEAQGDSGISALLQAGKGFFPDTTYLRSYRPFGFLDAGYIENNDPSAFEQNDELLFSVGAGIDFEFPNGYFATSYVAVPLEDGPETDSGDPAFYLALTKTW